MIEENELKLALEKKSKHECLIENAIDSIFTKNGVICQNKNIKRLGQSYQDFDTVARGSKRLISDLKILSRFYPEAINIIRNTTNSQERSNCIGVIGCGAGRLAVPFIELSKKLGIKKILFNDLFPKHIEETRSRIRSAYDGQHDVVDGIEIIYIDGDFAKISNTLVNKFDVLFAMWYVTSEIADFSSVENLRLKRQQFYIGLQKTLTKQGVFVEDSPCSQWVGLYYYLAQLKTYSILKKSNILNGESHNIIVQPGPQIGHIRYAPPTDEHIEKLRQCGFKPNIICMDDADKNIKNLHDFCFEFESSHKVKQLFSKNELNEIVHFLERKDRELLISPLDAFTKKRAVILWRKSKIMKPYH